MSLFARIIVWNLSALVLALALTFVIGGLNARQSVANEVSAAVASAKRGLERATTGPQAVFAFDGSRHVRVSFYTSSGILLAQSVVADEPNTAPAWIVRALTPGIEPVTVSQGPRRYVIEPIADNEVHEAWGHARDVALFPLLTAGLLAAIVGFVVERALRPLHALRAGLAAIAEGDYRARVSEAGSPEVVDLLRGFNRMGAQLATAEARNRALLLQLERVQEEERADLARDLHDEIGSYLFAASMDCATMVSVAREGDKARLLAQAEVVQGAVAHVQAHVRMLLERLRADPALVLRLTDGLKDLTEFWRLRAPGIEFVVDAPAEEPEFDTGQVTNLYRLTQEALTNAVRHGAATAIKVSLAQSPDKSWLLTITDNGRGGGGPAVEPGFGLMGMRERAAAAGGTFEAGPNDGGGWSVRVGLPGPCVGAEGAFA
jgi:two-component system sensor histidine kinase UhpB